jgi:hypothetical protein
MLGDSFNKLMAYDGSDFAPKNLKELFHRLKRDTGVKWRSASETSLQLGNSNAVLMNHYKGIATREQTDEFLNLLA